MITTFHKQFSMCAVFIMILSISFGNFLLGCSDEDDILPNIVLSINALDFGGITVESHSIQTVTLKNLISQDVIVARVTLTNETFRAGGYFIPENDELVPLVLPFTIEKGAARTLYIGFYPEEAIEYNGLLVIESRKSSDNPSQIETDILTLEGTGLPETD